VKHFKVGEVAKMAGISVRSLHHYDELGLLRPSGGRRSQHRLYNANDIVKLHQIMALKTIGFSLKEVRHWLSRKDFDLKTSLLMQKGMIEKKIEEYKDIDQTLRLMLSRLSQNQDVKMEELLALMKEIRQMENIYTKEQLQKIKDRYEKYGLDKVKEVEDAWVKLFEQFEDAKENGVLPNHPDVQALAKLAQTYIDLFTGGDKEIEAKLDQTYEQQQAHALEKWGVKKEVFDYAIQARKFYKGRS